MSALYNPPLRGVAAADVRVGDVTDDFLAVLRITNHADSVVLDLRGADRVATRIYEPQQRIQLLDREGQ